VALDLTLVGVATFAVGLAILWYGLSSLARSFPISLIALVGGCAIAVLGALRVITTDLGEAPDMAWPAAGFIGACLCLWSFDTFRVKALPVAKPLS